MIDPSRRSVLRGSLAVAASAGWRGPISPTRRRRPQRHGGPRASPEEDVAFRKLVADYEKASGNTIDYSIVPFAPLRQKEISAITSGAVPELMEDADFAFTPLNAWQDKLVDVSDIVETQKSQYIDTALHARLLYNNAPRSAAIMASR